jgi:hypothetical protein
MTVASAYAATMAGVAAPASWTGPEGQMVATVDINGNCQIVTPAATFTVPAAVLVNFATWINATFT